MWMLRLDVDASHNSRVSAYAIGGALRDHQGKLILVFGQQTKTLISVLHGELMALEEGLGILLEKGYQNVIVTTDSLGGISSHQTRRRFWLHWNHRG